MGRIMPRIGTLALMVGWLAIANVAPAEDRTADQIVKELDSIKPPQPGNIDRNDQAAVKKFLDERKVVGEKRSALIGELMKVAPEDARLAELAPERWGMLVSEPDTKALREELDAVLSSGKNESLAKEAAYIRAALALYIDASNTDAKTASKLVSDFASRVGKDPRVPSLKFQAATFEDDPAKKNAMLDELLKESPGGSLEKQIEKYRVKIAGLGKPFDLEFTDAIKGSPVSIKGLKGKVVVLDFWATWCGPCLKEMPKMKDLYAKYRDKGVEFIGVSLDQSEKQGGLDKLKDYVDKNKVEWPQYYQGNFWQSEFSSNWGVNSIPCVFLVDADGKLASVDARGKLEKLIPEYLTKSRAEIK